MKRMTTLPLLCCLTIAPIQAMASEQLVGESKAAIKEFMGQLKGELKKGLKNGGPVNAIQVCSKTAAPIAKATSQAKGLNMSRTSLKYRNPNNKPDAWEQAVLEKFDARKAAGEDVMKMDYSEVVTTDGKKTFRYMKAIPTAEKPCLMCHGSNLNPEVAAKLDELYPGDKARGFKAGDIRGAFSISKDL